MVELGAVGERVSALEAARAEDAKALTLGHYVERLEERVRALETADAAKTESMQWDVAQFNQGEADLRWAKEQTTAVARNSALLSGAILATSKLVDVDQRLFFWITLAQAVLAIYWEVQLHLFSKTVRTRVNALLSKVQRGVQPEKLENHLILAIALCVLVAGAAILAIAAPLLPR